MEKIVGHSATAPGSGFLNNTLTVFKVAPFRPASGEGTGKLKRIAAILLLAWASWHRQSRVVLFFAYEH